MIVRHRGDSVAVVVELMLHVMIPVADRAAAVNEVVVVDAVWCRVGVFRVLAADECRRCVCTEGIVGRRVAVFAERRASGHFSIIGHV